MKYIILSFFICSCSISRSEFYIREAKKAQIMCASDYKHKSYKENNGWCVYLWLIVSPLMFPIIDTQR